MSISGQQIRVNGIDLNVHIEGQGIPILLLHGFPDSNALWRGVIPLLVEAGYQVIAPDQRGFGESDAPIGVKHYRIDTIVDDAVALLDALGIEKTHLVAHDWGAVIGWNLACKHADRICSYTAISVGHPRAYAAAGWEQKRKAWYTVFFQLRYIAEAVFKARDWAVFRWFTVRHPEVDHWIGDLSRPGRLTAGFNWYRANLINLLFGKFPRCAVPVMGIWSSDDFALVEDQMINSARYVDNSFRYERLEGYSHWVPVDAPADIGALILDFIRTELP
jgi:pimeloyl-ACP methyl ester carboxylesterase